MPIIEWAEDMHAPMNDYGEEWLSRLMEIALMRSSPNDAMKKSKFAVKLYLIRNQSKRVQLISARWSLIGMLNPDKSSSWSTNYAKIKEYDEKGNSCPDLLAQRIHLARQIHEIKKACFTGATDNWPSLDSWGLCHWSKITAYGEAPKYKEENTLICHLSEVYQVVPWIQYTVYNSACVGAISDCFSCASKIHND